MTKKPGPEIVRPPSLIPTKLILRDYCVECGWFRDHIVEHSGKRITYTCPFCKTVFVVPDNTMTRNMHRRYILLHGRTLYTEQVVYDKLGAYFYPCPVEMVTGTGEGGLGIATLPDATCMLVVRILDGPNNYWKEYVREELNMEMFLPQDTEPLRVLEQIHA